MQSWDGEDLDKLWRTGLCPPREMCGSASLEGLRMWLYLQTVFKEINKLRPLSCALIQCDSCPCKKRKLTQKETPGRVHTEEGRVRTQRKSLAASQGAGPWENHPHPHHDLGCPASGAVRKQMSAIQASGDVRFCHGSPSKLIYKHYIEGQTT